MSFSPDVINKLNDLDVKDFEILVQGCINDLSGGCLLNREIFNKWQLKDYFIITKEIKSHIKKITIENLNKEQNILDEKHQDALWSRCLSQKEAIKKGLINNSLKATTHLSHFNWVLKLAVSSSKVQDLGQVLLALNLVTESNDGKRDCITSELTRTELDNLISVLKNSQQNIRSFSS